MWRAFFLSIGIFLVILGVECLAVEQVKMKFREPPAPAAAEGEKGANKKLAPPPWAPWSLMSSGVVVCLYSFTVPRRMKG